MAMAAVFLPKSILQYGCSHIVCFLINQSFLWVLVELTEKNDLCPAGWNPSPHSDILHGHVSFNINHDSRFDKRISLLA